MSSLLGEYHLKLDAKGRLKFPAGLKRQYGPEDHGRFVVKRGIDTCLDLYARPAWQVHSSRIKDQLNPFREDHRRFERIYFSGATEVELDGSDRILIPRSLMAYAGLDKELVLSARNDRVEIWDRARYDETLTVPPGEFTALAERVMGDFKRSDSTQISGDGH